MNTAAFVNAIPRGVLNSFVLLSLLVHPALSHANHNDDEQDNTHALMSTMWNTKTNHDGCALGAEYSIDRHDSYRVNLYYFSPIETEDLTKLSQEKLDRMSTDAVFNIDFFSRSERYKPSINLRSKSIIHDEILNHEMNDRFSNHQKFKVDQRVLERIVEVLLNKEVIDLQLETTTGKLKTYQLSPVGFTEPYTQWLACREGFLALQ